MKLDASDTAIIALLREDGRMPFRQMAEALGLNEATIRNRVRRLEQSSIIRIVARVDLKASGYPVTGLIGVKIRGRSVDEVSEELLSISEIISILAVIGRNDLEIQVIAKSVEALNDLIYEKIATIQGIAGLETSLATNVVKYEQPWGRFQ